MTLKNKILGSVPLSVGRYFKRLKGSERGFDQWGIRLDCHHTPHDTTTIIPRMNGTAVALPEDVHKFVHKVRDRYRYKEHILEQVENDFAVIRKMMTQRGHSKHEINESLSLVHEHNQKVSYTNPLTGDKITVDLYRGLSRRTK